MSVPVLRLAASTLDPKAADRLATGVAVGALLPLGGGADVAALARAVRAAAARHDAEAPPLVVVALDAWGPPLGPAFDLAALAHDAAFGGEPLEAMLAAMAVGRSLVAAGINAVIEPDPGDADPDGVEAVLDAVADGLEAAGVVLLPIGLPPDVDLAIADDADALAVPEPDEVEVVRAWRLAVLD